jgi:hypothetical protein
MGGGELVAFQEPCCSISLLTANHLPLQVSGVLPSAIPANATAVLSVPFNDTTLGTYVTDCVTHVNALRKTKGLSALARRTSDETCTNGNAKYDFAHPSPPHAAYAGGSYCGGMSGECECPQWPTTYGGIVKCMNQMWAEGPPPAGGFNHYSIMTNAHTSVSCGIYCANGKCTMTQDYL